MKLQDMKLEDKQRKSSNRDYIRMQFLLLFSKHATVKCTRRDVYSLKTSMHCSVDLVGIVCRWAHRNHALLNFTYLRWTHYAAISCPATWSVNFTSQCLAFSCPAIWSAIFMSCNFMSVIFSAPIWTGTKHNLSKIPGSGRALTLGGAHVAQSDDVRVLRVQLSSYLSFDKHVNVVSAKCFFQLRQLRRIRRSLNDDSVATLVHASVASRVDYCGSLLIGAPRKTTDKLQRVLNSAARIVSNTRKFDRGLTHFRRSQLHWLDVVDRVRFRVCVQVFRCLHKMAPGYLSTSGISGRRHLRSADRGHLDFPRVKLASYGGRSFAYAGPSNSNSLPAYLRDSSLSLSSFKHHLKTFLFSFY